MALLDLHKLTAGLSRAWVGLLTDGDRSLRSANYPETTLCRSEIRRCCWDRCGAERRLAGTLVR